MNYPAYDSLFLKHVNVVNDRDRERAARRTSVHDPIHRHAQLVHRGLPVSRPLRSRLLILPLLYSISVHVGAR
jgi:hypothetical protein